MARLLALDWDHKQLHLVAATVRGGAVRIDKAITFQEEKVPNPAEAEELGHLLRDRLTQAGFPSAPVLACIGRDRVILKDLRYPAVPDTEEPGVVRFQAVKELTDPPDEVVIDYARIGNGNGERRALALIARRELVEACQTLARVAGLKLAALTPRAFGIAACLERVMGSSTLTPAPEPPDAAVAVVALGERWGEFGVLRDGYLHFARAVEPGPGLAGEVRRNLAVYAGQAPQHAIRAIYVAGGSELAGLREKLRDMLDVPVYGFDPFAGAETPNLPSAGRGAFAGAVGLLHAQAAKAELPINLIKPRQPKPPRDPNQRRLILGGALAASLFIAAVAFCYMQLNAVDRQVGAQLLRNADLDRTLSVLEEESKKFKALNEWDRKAMVDLDELYDVAVNLPDPKTIQLTKLTVNPLDEPKSKYVARMTLEGIIASDPKLANRFMDGLGQDPHRRISPEKIEPNGRGGANAFNFRQKFTSSVDLEKPRPEKYTGRLPDAPAQDRAAEGDDQ